MTPEALARPLVGGLGPPYDPLIAAALRRSCSEVHTLAPLDAAALARGCRALPRGQCSTLVYTSGALLQSLDALRDRPPTALLTVGGCGPCRFSLFAPTWSRLIAREGHEGVAVVALDQSPSRLLSALGEDTTFALTQAIIAADMIAEATRRLAPHVSETSSLDAAMRAVLDDAARAIERRASAADAVKSLPRRARALPLRPAEPLARVALVGDPWSLHVSNDPQLNLTTVLAAAGAEIDAPPLSLWLAYVLWQLRQPRWGLSPLSDDDRALAPSLEQQLRSAFGEAARAAGLRGFALPDVDALARLASPHLSPSLRGGYGHVEVGLALSAAAAQSAHLVLSIKSFGCIPSAGVADAIIPAALSGRLPFQALDLCADGLSARESRLQMRLSTARDRAIAELGAALAGESADLRGFDPLAHGRRPDAPFACTLAAHAHEMFAYKHRMIAT